MAISNIERDSVLDNPQAVALRALGFLASNRPEFDRFLSGAGISQGDLDRHPICGEHLAAILDYVITNETTLQRFSRALDLPLEAAYEARRKLGWKLDRNVHNH